MVARSKNRDAAILRGEKTYEVQKPCKVCGSKVRYVKSYGCRDCQTEKGIKNLADNSLMSQYRTKEKKKMWLDKNADAVKIIKKRYKDGNKDKTKQYYDVVYKETQRDRNLKQSYGISINEYNLMLEQQDNKCAICKTSSCISGRRFAVDHCHLTGKIRGLLCFHCNSALGQMKDDVNMLKNAIEYLENFK